jgi:hypothetical protein
MAAASPAWTRRTRRPSHLIAPGSWTSGRSTSLAGSRADAVSATATAASTSASVPVSREQRKSGSMLMVAPVSGHNQRAIRHPGGDTRG